MYLCYVLLLWCFSNTVLLYDKGLLLLWCLLALLGTSLSIVLVIWLVKYGPSDMVCLSQFVKYYRSCGIFKHL